MIRITKDPDERRNEIIDAAEKLFLSQGFVKTAVSDIVHKIGVAQGLFYYYFKSKGEVLDAIAERYAERMIQRVEVIANDSTMNAVVKISQIFTEIFAISKGKEELIDHIHQEPYEEMHRRLTLKTLEKLIPIFSAIIREGMGQGLFRQGNPEAFAEILLSGIAYYLNKATCEHWGEPEFDAKLRIALVVWEQALGAPQDSLQLTGAGMKS
jgi:AcrR family transcriptional regulator